MEYNCFWLVYLNSLKETKDELPIYEEIPICSANGLLRRCYYSSRDINLLNERVVIRCSDFIPFKALVKTLDEIKDQSSDS